MTQAGITEHAVMFPVDSIKVRLSLPYRPLFERFTAQTRMQVFATSPAAIYTGVGNAFTRISATEGIRTLWRGVSSVILGAGPAHAVHFGTYEMVKELAGGNERGNQWLATCTFGFFILSLLLFSSEVLVLVYLMIWLTLWSTALAGASATIASDALMNPFDGKLLLLVRSTKSNNPCSHQAADASTQI